MVRLNARPHSVPSLLVPSLLLVTVVAACGGEAPLAPVPSDGPANEEPISTSADCDPNRVVVGSGGARVSRTAKVSVAHGEAPADLSVWVSGPDGKQAGELYPQDGQTVFLPVQPYPAGATMTWHVRMCGDVFSGTFETGALMGPVSDEVFDDAIAGHSFALDLRVGAWSAPFDEALARMVYSLGGALIVDVLERDGGVVRVSLAAAHPDNAGGYQRLDEAIARVFELPFGDNPYAFVALDAFTLPTTSGEVTLRDAIVGVGFDDTGVSDAFVEARLALDADTCAVLETAGAPCAPCSDDDDDAACVTISVDGLYGLPL